MSLPENVRKVCKPQVAYANARLLEGKITGYKKEQSLPLSKREASFRTRHGATKNRKIYLEDGSVEIRRRHGIQY
jgi:hypothetical protein